MITRLPEVDVVHKVNIEIKSSKFVANVHDKLDLINSVNIGLIGRIGTKKDNSSRPLKINVFRENTKY